MSSRKPYGFTIIELIVVLAVIATLAAVVGPELMRNTGDARIQAAQSQVEMFGMVLDGYRIDNHNYPTTDQGLTSLRTMPTSGNIPPNWRGPYLRKTVPVDPWGNPYRYRAPGQNAGNAYELYTLGRDGQIGGEGEDGDITSWGGQVLP